MKNTIIALSVVLAAFASAAGDAFKTGFARTDITPPLGTPLAGYYHYRPSTGILDPLEAICVAVCDGEKTALLYSIDHLHINNGLTARIKSAVAKAVKVDEAAVYIASTHTHLGPNSALGGEVTAQKAEECARAKAAIEFANELILRRMVDAAVYAIADLAPSKIAVARGEAPGLSFIRRFKMKDGTTRTNPGVKNPNIDRAIGQSDDSLQLVRFIREGRPDIAIINFQTHPDVIGGSRYSADWPGFARRQLEKSLDGAIHAVLFNGAQGDTNHINVNPSDDIARIRRYELSRHMGRKIAGVALGLWDVAKTVESGKIGYKVAIAKIPPKAVDPAKIPYYREVARLHREKRDHEIKMTTGVGMERTSIIAEAQHCLDVVDRGIKSFDMPVSCVTVGRALAFCGFPGEPFTELGLAVKRASAFAMTIPTCCTGGSFGYLPVASAYDEGGYEQRSSRYAKGVGELLVKSAVTTLGELYPGDK